MRFSNTVYSEEWSVKLVGPRLRLVRIYVTLITLARRRRVILHYKPVTGKIFKRGDAGMVITLDKHKKPLASARNEGHEFFLPRNVHVYIGIILLQ